MWLKTSILMSESSEYEDPFYFEIPLWINATQIVSVRRITKDPEIPQEFKRSTAVSTTDGNTYYLKPSPEEIINLINPNNEGGITIDSNPPPPNPTLDTCI